MVAAQASRSIARSRFSRASAPVDCPSALAAVWKAAASAPGPTGPWRGPLTVRLASTFCSSRTLPGHRMRARAAYCLARQGRAAAGRLGNALPAVFGEPGDVRPARRGRGPDDVKVVAEVLAEAALGRLGVKGPVPGGDDPQVEPLNALLAEAADLAVLEHAPQLRPSAQRQLGRLVEKDRAGGQLQQALAVLPGTCEGALRMPEQLGLEHIVAEHGAVDQHEGGGAVRTLRDQFLLRVSSIGDRGGDWPPGPGKGTGAMPQTFLPSARGRRRPIGPKSPCPRLRRSCRPEPAGSVHPRVGARSPPPGLFFALSPPVVSSPPVSRAPCRRCANGGTRRCLATSRSPACSGCGCGGRDTHRRPP